MELDIKDAVKIREALEPATHAMVGGEKGAPHADANLISITSVAISLRRIADQLEKQNRLIETLTNVHKTKR
jgi:hypothetical protein